MIILNKLHENKPVAFFDVDGTIFNGHCITEFPKPLLEKHLFPKKQLQILLETKRDFENGKIDYFDSGVKIQTAYAKGIIGKRQKDVLKVGYEYFLNEGKKKLFKFTERLIGILKNNGYVIILESGSPYEIIRPIGDFLGVDYIFASQYKMKYRVFVDSPPEFLFSETLAEKKRERAIDFINIHSSDVKNSIGFGDSGSDILFMKELGNAVAILPKPDLEKTAIKNQWLICDQEDQVIEQVKGLLNRLNQ